VKKIEVQDPTNHRNRIVVDIARYKILKQLGWKEVEAVISKEMSRKAPRQLQDAAPKIVNVTPAAKERLIRDFGLDESHFVTYDADGKVAK